MNGALNKYLYQSFLLFRNINLIEKQEWELSDLDHRILRAFYGKIKRFKGLDYDTYLNIIKKLSLDYNKIPVEICNILYKEENKNLQWQNK